MKRIRLQLVLVIRSLLVFLPCPVVVRAQDEPQDGKKVVDTYSTVIGMVYPAAGAMFKVAGEMLDMFGYFNHPDPVGEAIKLINARLDILERKVSDLETKMRAFESELFRTQNMTRVRLLRSKQDALKLLAYKLQQKPTEQRDRLALAKEAEIIAAGFLDDSDLWMWSDLRERDAAMLAPDFKPMPALEYYMISLVTLMVAIENATDSDYEFVKREYGRELQKHIAFLTVRQSWRDGDEPATLPENVRARISCSLELLNRSPHAITHKCTIHEGCKDQLARSLSTVAIHETTMSLNSEFCNVPFSTKKMASEEELERMYGTPVMEKLAEKLELLKTRGTARENYIGTFDPSTQTAQFIYGMKANGDLLWYRHRVVTRKTGVPLPRTPSPTEPSRRHDTRTGNRDPRIRLPAERGTLAEFEATHFLDGPKRVGSGWENFRGVMPAGLSGVYALTQDGKLLWYNHINYETGERSWKEVRQVGSGWGDFKQIIPMGDGIVYALTPEGKLFWYRHIDFANGVKAWEGTQGRRRRLGRLQTDIRWW